MEQEDINKKIIEAIQTLAGLPGFMLSYNVETFDDKPPFSKKATQKTVINITLSK